MNQLSPVYTEKTACQDCYKCVRACPVKAIQVQNGSATIMSEECIHCGRCVSICPAGAKHVRNDINRVRHLLKRARKSVVSLAPSFVSTYPERNSAEIIQTLYKLGFDLVSETALGAESVSRDSVRLLHETETSIHLSTACPVAVRYIHLYQPQLSGLLSPHPSPLLAHCQLLRRHYGNDISIVFIGPCIAKKDEADNNRELLDAALTFDELDAWLNEEGLSLNKPVPLSKAEAAQASFQPVPAGDAAEYPREEGMVQSIRKSGKLPDNCHLFACAGMERTIGTLKEIPEEAPESLPEGKLFLELLACPGGCLQGPGASGEKQKQEASPLVKEMRLSNLVAKRRPVENTWLLKELSPMQAAGTVRAGKPVPEPDLQKILQSIGKYSRDDELNCGGCGYDNCRDFARAVYRGRAERTMCVSWMRKLAQKKANALLKAMPAGTVIVDRNLHIVECNQRFATLIGEDAQSCYEVRPGLEGMPLDKFVSFASIFASVVETGQEILKRELRTGDTILEISLFNIEKHQFVGAVFQDITSPTVSKDRIINKAESVIRQNLKTVQKIAYLLGENAAESEMLLESIINSMQGKGFDDTSDAEDTPDTDMEEASNETLY